MARIKLSLSPESETLIARHRANVAALRQSLGAALREGLTDAENHLKINYLRGGDAKTARGGQTPLASRSGALLGDTTSKLDQPLSGWVGVPPGKRSTNYARTVLGKDDTTIVPRKAQFLWVPIADNLDPSGRMRQAPSQVMNETDAAGERRVIFLRSKKGEPLAFLPDAQGGRYARGKKKGLLRGQLLFVLKKQVEIKGTDALATAVGERADRIEMLLRQAAAAAFGGRA